MVSLEKDHTAELLGKVNKFNSFGHIIEMRYQKNKAGKDFVYNSYII